MNRHEKLCQRILGGRSDANIGFDALTKMLLHFGFDERVSASHHVFRKEGIEERINLQRDGTNAKVYQIRQVRAVILRHGVGVEDEETPEEDEESNE